MWTAILPHGLLSLRLFDGRAVPDGDVHTVEEADTLKLNTPWTIPIIYLGFGAGLAIFMFVGFVKSIPLEIEEAAAIDGCGPLRTYFSVVLPMLRPTMISVGILEIMWVWNDYLLPYLVLDRTKYMTIPIHIQYLKGSYGTVDLGATMALILLSIILSSCSTCCARSTSSRRGRRRGKGLTPFILHFPERSGSIDRTFLRHSDADLVPSLAPRIGTMGKAAYDFADFLAAAGQKYWQLLPLGPTSYGDSPYQSFSSFAGNPYFIDLDLLVKDKLLTRVEVNACDWGDDPRYVDYGKIYASRFTLLEKAKMRGFTRDREAVTAFERENERWLPNYALFMRSSATSA